MRLLAVCLILLVGCAAPPAEENPTSPAPDVQAKSWPTEAMLEPHDAWMQVTAHGPVEIQWNTQHPSSGNGCVLYTVDDVLVRFHTASTIPPGNVPRTDAVQGSRMLQAGETVLVGAGGAGLLTADVSGPHSIVEGSLQCGTAPTDRVEVAGISEATLYVEPGNYQGTGTMWFGDEERPIEAWNTSGFVDHAGVDFDVGAGTINWLVADLAFTIGTVETTQ